MAIVIEKENPNNIVILCHTHGEILLKKDQTAKFYDEKSKLAGLCPICGHAPRSIYSCNRVNDYLDKNK